MLALVDGHQWLHRIMHVEENQARFSSKARLVGPADAALCTLCSLIHLFSARQVVVAWDGGTSARRKALYPAYKENRTAQKSAKNTFDYPNAFKWSRALVLRALPLMGIRSIEVVGREGDDLLGLLAGMLGERRVRTTIVSEDKDLYALVRPGIDHYRPVRDLLVTAANFEEKVGVSWDRFLLYRALVGDKSDNISGVTGVGEVTATQFVKSLEPEDVELGQIVQRAAQSQHARVRRIGSARAIVERNLELLDVAREEWTGMEVAQVRGALEAPVRFDRRALRELVQQEELASFGERLASWAVDMEALR